MGVGVKLARAEQDRILVPIVLATRNVDHSMGTSSLFCRRHNVESFRFALRLDDPVLDDIIASRAGQPWPWSSEVVRV